VSRNNFQRWEACLQARGQHFKSLWQNKVNWTARETKPINYW
jgi:hypothetical protein